MSNRPQPLAGLGGTPGTSLRQTVSTESVLSSASTFSGPIQQSSSVPNSAVRDELVRAVMPELRVLMQHLVNAAVERSMAPLLDKQRELEATLKDVRSAQLRAEQAPSTCTRHAAELATPTGAVHAETRPFANPDAPVVSRQAVAPSPVTVAANPVLTARAEVLTVGAYDANALVDIPPELDGSRRRRVVAWAFAVAVAVLLLSAGGLSVLSQMGTYF